MASMDIFEGDAFSIIELTRALENIPYKPATLSGSGLFGPRGVRSRTVVTLRDEVLPERIPAAGVMILRDGQPGEPEVTLSPLRYHYQHRAELEVVVQAGTGRASAFDTLIAAIGTAMEADRTLGGLCDWVEPEAPASVDLPIEGAAALKAAVITVVLHYTTTGPLA
ncbi:MAG: hypothetical protein FD162_3131 [Rhodobacteraceae bacterium]|nr:MAG: hypothetical protein FD162_3131 [Paracoccaceae bacterium]